MVTNFVTQRGRSRIVALAACLMATLLAGSAHADIWHYAGRWVDFSWNVNLGEEYDDNIFNSAEDEEEDFITTLGFDTHFIIRHPYGSFNLSYRFDQDFYLDHSELNDVGSVGSLGQNQYVSFDDSMKLSPRDTFTYFVSLSRSPDSLQLVDRSRTSDLQNTDLEGVVVGRDPVFRNVNRVSYNHQFTVPVNLGANGGYTITEYDDPDRNDSRTQSIGADLSWRITPIRILGLSYNRNKTEFDSVDGTTSDVVSVFYQDEFAPTWSLFVSVGASFNESRDDSVDDVTPDIQARLSKQFRRGSGAVGYTRSIGTSGGFGGASENQAITADATYRHTDLIISTVSATFSERLSDVRTTGDTNRMTARYNIGYPLSQRLRLNGGYTFSRQERDGAGVDGTVTNNRVFISLSYGATIL